ncbi:MAG: preprotein translocase subunit SecG [Proteobacteria bacterium]|nr:preprotein translocase subunit SecG [Pseudomonadota bacterium]
MTTILLVIHLLLALAMIATVLLQRSEGGALGIGGGGGALMSGRASSNLLTRATAVLAGLFMLSSMLLTIIATGTTEPRSILESAETPASEAPVEPVAPSVPIAD